MSLLSRHRNRHLHTVLHRLYRLCRRSRISADTQGSRRGHPGVPHAGNAFRDRADVLFFLVRLLIHNLDIPFVQLVVAVLVVVEVLDHHAARVFRELVFLTGKVGFRRFFRKFFRIIFLFFYLLIVFQCSTSFRKNRSALLYHISAEIASLSVSANASRKKRTACAVL